ncbi:hypothetical protein [Lutibacter sp.]|uniref:hypothetical protein n=1 Tax=Lutibacter sp. TaxID=1925666 RepID=UPI00349FFBC5
MEEVEINFTQEDAMKMMSKAIEIPLERKKEEKEKAKKFLLNKYLQIIEILKEYTDLEEDNYKIIALWIIGTYFHEQFSTYPYLFLYAIKGSGKTRVLRLIAKLSNNGRVLLSPTEAVMFRIPKGETICIDELEGIMNKENGGLREMLNACYKKGSTVLRMKQKKINGSTEQVIDEFEPYKPICIANINGMENVLEDRCITLILERSDKEDIMRLVEDFDENLEISDLKASFEANLVQLCSVVLIRGNLKPWNNYVKFKYFKTTYNTQTTQNTPSVTKQEKNELFEKVINSNIKGRNLELFFPLILLASNFSDSVVSEVIEIAKKMAENKQKEDEIESKDKSLYDFVSKQNQTSEYKKMRLLLMAFRSFVGNIEDSEDKWLNEKWLGKALKRLNLIVDKRRVSSGIEVTLDIEKAKKKMESFK